MKKTLKELFMTQKNKKTALFMGDSILAAANKVLDFDEFKKQQANKAIDNYNQNLLENAETINYADDINLDDVKDNKDLKITAKKISEKYRKLRKRKAANQEKKKRIIDRFNLPTKKTKRQVDKAALLASKNISKKYKNIRFC